MILVTLGQAKIVHFLKKNKALEKWPVIFLPKKKLRREFFQQKNSSFIKNPPPAGSPPGTWSAHILRAAKATPVSPNQNGSLPENPVSPKKPAGRLDRLKKNNGGQRQNKCSRGFLAIFGGQALSWNSLLPPVGCFPKQWSGTPKSSILRGFYHHFRKPPYRKWWNSFWMMSFTLSKNAGHLEVSPGWMLLPELPEGIIGLA